MSLTVTQYVTGGQEHTHTQLATARAHRSVLEASQMAQMTKLERLLAMTASTFLKTMINDASHETDQALCTTLEDKLKG